MHNVTLERAVAALESGDFRLALAIAADEYEDGTPATQREPDISTAPTLPCPGVAWCDDARALEGVHS
jgi:hypothetical protein